MWQQISEGGSTDASPPEVPSLWLLELTALAQVVDDKKKKKKERNSIQQQQTPSCFSQPLLYMSSAIPQ